MSDPIVITLPADLDPVIRQRILDALPPDQLTLGEAADAAPDAAGEAIDAALATAPSLFDSVTGALSRLDAALDYGLPLTLALTVLALGVGYAAERLALRLTAGSPRPRPADFVAQLALAGRHAARHLAGLLLFALTAMAVTRLALPQPALALSDAIVMLMTVQRFSYIVLDVLAAPDAPNRRLAGLTDAEARFIMRVLGAMIAIGVALNVAVLVVRAGDPTEATRLARALLALASAIPTAAFFFMVRRPVKGLVLRAFGGAEAAADPMARFIAANWQWFYVLIGALTALSRATAQLGLPGYEIAARSGMFSILTAVLTPFLLAGVGIWRDERLAASPEGGRAAVVGGSALARGLIVAAAATLVLTAWGLDPFAVPREGASGIASAIPSLVRMLFVVIVGLAIWRAVGEAMQAYGKRPTASTDPIDEDKTIGTGASRLETVMPVLRGVALAGIGLTTVMLALSMLGVNIAPILAGVGVLGLAIGFGSQQLVRDVISGAFYLYEDAFRVGEYIETGQGKGVVEHISVRSVRLRHPRGPVFTVPFATMGTIQNHSRDWVKTKFTFDVPQDTDLEKVRKLVKKAGEALLADPDLDGRFLEPMKSQGAVAITGQAFSIGVKFVTRPGQQFLARRKAMAVLQKTFRDNGIELMTPRITLDKGATPDDLARAMASTAAQ